MLLLFGLAGPARGAYAYPDEEKAQLSLTDITAQAAQMHLTSDNRYLYVGFNNKVKVVDMGTFDLRSSGYQPYDFGSSTEYSGIVGGLALSTSRLYVSKDDGDLLYFSLDNLTAEPAQVTISSGTELGKIALNSSGSTLYIVDSDNNKVIAYTIGSGAKTTIDPAPTRTGASITDMLLVSSVSGGNDYVYLATDKGLLFYIVDGNTTAAESIVADATDNLLGLGVRPGKETLYVINTTDKSVLVLNPTTLSVTKTVELKIDEATSGDTYNDSLEGLVSKTVTNPSSTYTFIAGLYGVSVLDGDNVLIDAATNTTDTYDYNPILIANERRGPMITGSEEYVYMSNADGSISVITEKPFVTISGVTYSGGGSSMSTGESATITFQSDEDGTYRTLIGGSIDESGTAASSSTATGSVTASTDTQVTIAYDDNSSVLQEGSNTVFIFVTDGSSDVGRDAAAVSVDTPPPAPTVTGTGFGNTRLYVNITRLTVSDMSYYNVYVSTDADAVVNKTVSAHQISQPSSGSTVVAEIGGLANDTLYYASVEAVDAGGNVSTLTSTFPDGSRITGTPELTVGPAQLTGEKGCSLVEVSKYRSVGVFELLLVIVFLLWVRFRQTRRSHVLILFSCVFLICLLFPGTAKAEEATPQWWSTELKGGFWLPMNSTMKRFFDPCCHLTGIVEQGFLYQSKYGVEIGIGYLSENGTALGASSGGVSQDRFNLFLLPMETNLAFRADFLENQIIVPFVKFGFDYVYFRQNLKGNVVEGVKTGLHTSGGIQILLDLIDKGAQNTMECDFGINDIYFTLEGRYSWINDFGGGGLDLSSLILTGGLLFEY